ncbi:hypothetical protein [Jeongeupia sp. USM3]|uniref:hypothetical protein n=1 Tax=Jeongeupia sp. USM3 TaxID=1906741 RepID=UPI00089DF546|nr:hypothetical protein [Jeongeupia sp. USM3]AOY01289.1 hypothetical protein BJP62_13025 [Jeongeupia sp. USM3]
MWPGLAPDGLIVLSPRGLAVGALAAGAWVADAHFASDAAGLADFAAYCRHRGYRRFRILVPGGDEAFSFDTLPPLGRRDRRALMQRRLDQAYRGMPYRYARLLADGTLVLSALTQRAPLDAVVQTLLDARCAVAGIHATSALIEAMLFRIGAVHGPTLLLSPLADAGIQQAWLTAAGLRFTRLSQGQASFAGLPAEALAPVLADEVRLTLQYLTSERVLQRGSTVTVLLLDDGSRVAALAGLLQRQLAESGEGVHVVPLSGPGGSSGPDLPALLAGEIGRGRWPAHYAAADVRRFETLRRAGLALRAAGGLVLAASLLWSASVWHGVRELEARTVAEQAALRSLQRESQRVSDALLKRDVGDPVALRAVDALYRGTMASWPSAEASARRLSRVMAAYPGLRIDALEWDVALPAAPPDEAATDAEPSTGGVASQGASPAAPNTRVQTLSLAGQVQAPADYRQALARVDALVRRLRAEPGLSVDVVTLPLDVRSHATLQGRPAEAAEAMHFALKLTLADGALQ